MEFADLGDVQGASVKTSLFEIFKIGIGPSSSHTVGPMRAAADFAATLAARGVLDRVHRVQTELFGSLALTGRGHGTDRAILLGLSGELPDRIDPASIEPKLAAIRSVRRLAVNGVREIAFDEAGDLLFLKDRALPGHSNGMRFQAFGEDGEIARQVYYSIGGGFVEREGEASGAQARASVPYAFSSADELLRIAAGEGMAIWQIALANEKTWHSEAKVREFVAQIWTVMRQCAERGLATEGILPGGLSVRRRAPNLARRLSQGASGDPLAPMDWVNVFAMAVNEENAAGGRVVTAPTNGAAGIIPAVALYYQRFVPEAHDEGLFRYFLTAGAIGIL